jgi:hypothetical protein
VHDISRIGLSKRKLEELVDGGILNILDVPDDLKLSDAQKNQIISAKTGKTMIDESGIREFLSTLQYPLAFFDYETYACAIPRYDGYSPYNQIPFQFSVHIMEEPNGELIHKEFLFTENKNPDMEMIKALQEMIPAKGSVVSWHKSFEIGRNNDLAKRNPEYKKFIDNLNDRMVDLEDIFKAQFYVHPDFKGKTSIKYALPALVPELSYKKLEIKEGGTASNTWNQIVTGGYSKEDAEKQKKNLLEYCKLDTFAMVKIFEHLRDLVK